MRKHQFVKVDCNCAKRATYFKCKHCGDMEYGSPDELRAMETLRATCTSQDAPKVSPTEKMQGAMGGAFNCLAPDGMGE